MQKKYESKGLALVAIHRQSESLKAKALALLKANGCNYTVTQQGALVGDNSRGIPRAWVFDHTGKKTWEGHPTQMDGAIADAVAKAPHWMTRGRTFTDKSVRSFARKLNSNRSFGKLANDLTKLVDTSEDSSKTKEEATFLRDNIVNHGQAKLDQAKANETQDPGQAQRDYKMLASLYKGHDVGDKASARMKELKTDKGFQKELKADALYQKMDAVVGSLKPGGLGKKANISKVNTIRQYLAYLKKKYPETAATRKAISTAKSLGITQ